MARAFGGRTPQKTGVATSKSLILAYFHRGTGLSDLLKPLNAEAGVVAKEDSIPTVIVLFTGA